MRTIRSIVTISLFLMLGVLGIPGMLNAQITVSGTCQSSGPLPSYMQVTKGFKGVNKQLTTMSSQIATGFSTNSQTIQRVGSSIVGTTEGVSSMVESQGQQLSDAVHEANQEHLSRLLSDRRTDHLKDSSKIYGHENRLVPSTGFLQGKAGSNEASSRIMNEMRSHNEFQESKAMALYKSSQIPLNDAFFDEVYPANGVLEMDGGNDDSEQTMPGVVNWLRLATNPLPQPPFTGGENFRRTTAGAKYSVLNNHKRSQLTAIQRSISDIAADRFPSLTLVTSEENEVSGWLRDMTDNLYGDIEDVGIEPNSNGKISEDQLRDVAVDMRLRNTEWYDHITTSDDVSIAREQARMQAFQMDQMRRMNKLLEKLVMLTGLDSTKNIRELNNQLERLKQDARDSMN